ncbi:MAG: LCP family protein [Clostridia bacterium]|nr:LCP family protein [Clostridia bacterium]MBR2413976.1 LCP family protein [Clostridia bacterium]
MKKAVPFIIFGVIAAILIACCGVAGAGLADCTFVPETAPENAGTEFIGVVDSAAELNTTYYDEISKMKDLQDLVAAWGAANNDAKMHLGTVTTFLIVVKEAGTVATNYGNADVISLVSVNSEAKKVSVLALDPDSLVYIDLADTKLTANGPVYAKLNTAYANGGIALLEKTVENNFKIEIDHYLVTDMNGVAAIADAVGGVSVMLDKELKKMITDDFNVIMPADNTPLKGEQIVAYLREKRDGADNHLARQADSLAFLIKSVQTRGFGEAIDFVKELAAVVKTDLAGGELVNVLRRTVLGAWSDYNVVSYTAPDKGTAVQYKDSAWIRIIDIPVVAQSMQDKLFNKTNISLNDSRLSAVELIKAVNKLHFDEIEKQNASAIEGELTEGEENAETEDSGSVG